MQLLVSYQLVCLFYVYYRVRCNSKQVYPLLFICTLKTDCKICKLFSKYLIVEFQIQYITGCTIIKWKIYIVLRNIQHLKKKQQENVVSTKLRELNCLYIVMFLSFFRDDDLFNVYSNT